MRLRYLLLVLLLGLCFGISAQNKLYLPPIKYTATGTTAFNQVCYQTNGIQFWINNTQWIKDTDYTEVFCAYGICKISFPFGKLKPGDTFEVRDACGSVVASRTVEDDYVYVEVPNGTSYTGNGINSTDESAPYTRLSTPVSVGKCEPIPVNAHGLHKYTIFVSPSISGGTFTSGRFLINGSSLSSSMVSADLQGAATPVSYSVNSNGSITYNGAVAFASNLNFSGRTPFSFEYQHNGVLPFNVQEYTLGAMGLRLWDNGRITVKEYAYSGTVETDFTGDFTNAIFKITYDGASFKLYIDNVLKKTIGRSVIYSSSSGTISNTGLLTYGTGVTWQPSNSGSQWVSVIVDGVLSARQYFTVADDISINESVVNIACNGGSTGSITVNATGGKSALSYSKNNGAFQSSNLFSGLSVGSYTIKVRDASGCEASKTVNVTENAALNLSSSKNNANCVGENSGSVTLSGSGGIGTLQYGINNANYQNSNIFNSLGAGNYTFWLKDAAGCTKTLNETIGTNSTLNASVSASQNVNCFGANTGSITITSSGTPAGIIQYSIDGTNFVTSNVFNGLVANTYTVKVKDNLCTINVSSQVISQPTDISINPTVNQNISCFGGANGKITVTATGGTPSYQFSKDDNTYSSSGVFDNLGVNNYKFWVKDANGCKKESSVVSITQPTDLAVGIASKIDVTCNGAATGSVNISASGGTSAYEYSKDGTNYQSSATLSSLVAGSYTFTIKDANGCTKTTTSSILQPTAIVIGSPVITNLTCNADNSGQIVVNASAGIAPYQFKKNTDTYQSTGTFGTLSANTYTIYAKDANNCEVSISTTVTQPSAVGASITVTNNLCNADQTGKIVAVGNGGTPTYQYSTDGTNFVTSGTFSNLSSGSYTVKTKDSRGCLNSQNITVNQPTVLNATPSITKNVTCFGGNDGTINVLASGGTSPYQYSSNGTSFQTGDNFTFVIGTYSFWVKDANGCIKTTSSLTITQPTDIFPSLTNKTPVLCFGGNDGTATIAATGGVSPYTFSKDGSSFQSSGAFTGFSVGTFSLTVKDNAGCTKPISVQILQPAQALQISISSQTNLSCYQNNTGSIQAVLSGGTSPYQFSKDNTTFQTSGTFTTLSAGNYTIYGKDANNCTTNIGTTLTEPSNTSISLLQKQDVNCENYARGFFKVGASGGTGAFTYSLSGIDFNGNSLPTAANATGFFENLKIGNYTISFQDQNACSKIFPVTIISKNSPIRFDITKTLPTDCIAGNGNITVNNTRGGQGNYTYRISNQTSVNTTNSFTNLTNGTYYVTVTDNLCAYTEAVNLELPNNIRATYTINPINCQLPTANLTIVNITGGNGSYGLAIDGVNFSNNRNFNNLQPNTYAITIQDTPLSCKSVVSVEIKEQNRADLKVSSLGNISCFGGNNGFINAIGDNNMGPFTYAINNGGFSSNGNFSGLNANTYKISAQTRIGCLDSIRVTLSQPTLLQSNITLQSNLCNGDQTGKISIIGTGGVSPYQYTIDGSTYQTSSDFISLFAGNYTVTVKDNNGCAFGQNQNLTQPTLVTTASSVVQDVSCFAGNDGKGQVVGSGGTLPYTFSINGINFVSSNIFDGLIANTYQFWVKDANGCTKTSSPIIVNQPTLLVPSVAAFTNALCNGSSDGTITLAATGGTSPYQFSKDNNTYQNPTLLTAFPAGNFTVYVKDSKGCVKTIAQSITQPAPLSLNLVTKNDLTCFENQTGKFEVGINGGTQPYRYSLDNSTFQTSPIFANLKSGNYNVTGKDVNNCTFLLSTSLSEPALLTATFAVKTNDCYGDQTGKINAFAMGGTMPYEYSINNQTYQPSTEFAQLFAGNYLTTIRDKNACIFTQNVEVKQPEDLKLFPINQDLIRCFGEANGSILINTTGGTPKLIYSLDGKIYEDKPLFQNLKVGKYQIFVKDANQCFKQSEITLKEPDKLKISIIKQADPLCAGEQNGIIEVKAVGGNGGYTFIRDNISKNQTGLFEQLSQAEYTFKVLDVKQCEDNIEKVVLKWPIALTATIDKIITPACIGDANGVISLSLKGGILPYTSNLISEPLNVKPLVNDAITYDKLLSGNYQISLQDANGCQLQASVKVPIPDKLNAIDFASLLPKEVCKGQQLILNANNPNQTIQWYLNGSVIPLANVIFKENMQLSKDLQALTTSLAGKYSVSVKNASGCEVKAEYELVNNDKALKADFLLPVQVFVGDEVVALDITKPIPDKVFWTLPAEADKMEENIKRIKFAVVSEGKYVVQMQAFLGDCITIVKHDLEVFKIEDIDKTDPQLGYDKTQLINKVAVSPNPNYGKFTVTVDLVRAKPIEVSVVRAASGQTVFSTTFSDAKKQHVFDLDLKVRTDNYLLIVKTEDSVNQTRIAIID
jgi:SprB repeat